ncbi:hypothetical protein, partial [Klebsiella pneumoniae]|uniref:hypothetical protein n=1 Tax=Klebsiella pneumoniae TaxID=573 RepID=UPI001F4B8416
IDIQVSKKTKAYNELCMSCDNVDPIKANKVINAPEATDTPAYFDKPFTLPVNNKKKAKNIIASEGTY